MLPSFSGLGYCLRSQNVFPVLETVAQAPQNEANAFFTLTNEICWDWDDTNLISTELHGAECLMRCHLITEASFCWSKNVSNRAKTNCLEKGLKWRVKTSHFAINAKVSEKKWQWWRKLGARRQQEHCANIWCRQHDHQTGKRNYLRLIKLPLLRANDGLTFFRRLWPAGPSIFSTKKLPSSEQESDIYVYFMVISCTILSSIIAWSVWTYYTAAFHSGASGVCFRWAHSISHWRPK